MPDNNKFDLFAQEEVLPSIKNDPNYLRQVALGTGQGLGDITMLATAPEQMVHYGMSKILGKEIYDPVLAPGEEAKAELEQQELTPWQMSMLADDDLMPMISTPGARGRLGEAIEAIPTEGTLQEATRRVVRSLPGLAGGPAMFAEMATRELLGLGGKKIAEQLGFDELGQTIFDVGFSLFPNPKKFIEGGNKLISSAATGKYTTQKEMIEEARKLGWTENEIAPLIREGWFDNILKKLSPKGQATEKALDITKAATQKSFESVKNMPGATKVPRSSTQLNFKKAIEKAKSELPVDAEKIADAELAKLYKGNLEGRDFINFWGNLNSYFKDHPKLQKLKGPVGTLLKELDPNLSKSFDMANTLSNRYRTISKGLKPNLLSQLATAGEIGYGLKALLSLKAPVGVAGTMATRKLAELMTTNPRFMNLHKKMLTTVNAGQLKASEKIMNSMINMISKENPAIAAEIRKTSMEELRELIQAANVEEDLT